MVIIAFITAILPFIIAAVGPDGNPVYIVQQAYQPMVMKPGSNPGYTQQPQQHRQQQQPMPQTATMSPQGGQVVVPQYVGGVQQPLYVVQQPNRSHYGQQQVGNDVERGVTSLGNSGIEELNRKVGVGKVRGRLS